MAKRGKQIEYSHANMCKVVDELRHHICTYNGDAAADRTRALADAKVALKEGKRLYEDCMSSRKPLEEACFDAFTDDRLDGELAKASDLFGRVNCSFQELTLLEEQNAPMFQRQAAKYRLPDMVLPTFGGQYDEFVGFKKLFLAIMEKQTGLDDAAKLTFLRNQLKGQALSTIAMLGNSDAEYEEAWRLLTLRFGNVTNITNQIIAKIQNIPNMKEPCTAAKMRDVHYKVRGLWTKLVETDDKLGVEDASFRHKIPQLYTYAVRRDVEMVLGENPSVNDFLVEANRIIERDVRLTNYQEQPQKNNNNNNSGNKNKGGQAHHDSGTTAGFVGTTDGAAGGSPKGGDGGNKKGKNSKNKNRNGGNNSNKGGNGQAGPAKESNGCKVCNEKGHGVAGCKTFKSLSVEKREEKVKKLGLCFRCLAGGHRGANCPEDRKCRAVVEGQECGRPGHHTLLHKDR